MYREGCVQVIQGAQQLSFAVLYDDFHRFGGRAK